ncbi:hypothetical protein [Polaribacter sp. Q13]|uniref:hypothetical protein n=1 Tax=Polaribacter sp. Q13 TaxID=2806551 RepID=UPI00193BE5BB|nr:hypothetical protein [Polaribacter sp. Q13]QVY66123.1 hypothetical protein JOP69_02175 [Polaribacter sp. Q13]
MLNSKLIVFFISLLISNIVLAQTPVQLPENTGDQYEIYRDNSVSDEFNDKILDSEKWGRRNTGGASIQGHENDASLVIMEKEKKNGKTTKYVSIKATKENGSPKTAGLVSQAAGFYGFYTVKFRFRGFDTDDVKEKGSVWHPSVWSATGNYTNEKKRSSIKNSAFWTEIDLMEWENGPNGWSSDAPARFRDSKGVKRKVITKGKGAEKAIMTKGPFQTYDPVWQTLGLEYTPEYIKLWQWKNDEWVHMGKRVVKFVDEDETNPESKYTINTIGKNARNPAFWYLGNIVAGYVLEKVEKGINKHTINDLSVDFDFFRYYRHKSLENTDWDWENGLKNGGGEVQKDFSEIETVKN